MNTYPICDYAVDIALVYLLKKSSYKKNASSHNMLEPRATQIQH